MNTVIAAHRHTARTSLIGATLIGLAVTAALPAWAQTATATAGATVGAATRSTTPQKADGPRGVIGQMQTMITRHEDTLVDLARTLNVGYVELLTANPGVEPWLPGEGTQIVVPKAHLLPDVALKASWSTWATSGSISSPRMAARRSASRSASAAKALPRPMAARASR
ncbi:hypothetical protein ACFQ4K_25745 [Tistrella bauzanensis]